MPGAQRMAALTSKTGSTCPAFPSRRVPGLPGGLEELSQEQQMRGPDLPVEGLQVCSATLTTSSIHSSSQTPTDTARCRGRLLEQKLDATETST